jgi:hypothetical protein
MAGETNTFTPVNYQGNYLNNINSKILDKTQVFGYNKLHVEARGSFLRLEMINSVLNVTLHFYENTNFVTKSVRLESATEFPLANFSFDAPPFETINDTTSFVIDVDSLYLLGTPYSDAKLSTVILSYSTWGCYDGKRIDGTDNFLEYTIISDVTDNLTGTTEPYDYLRPLGEFTKRITNKAQLDELKAIFDNRNNFEYIGESNLITYTQRTDISEKPHYCYGVDRFIVNEDYVEIIFDDTFIEDSHKFYTPFKLKNYYVYLEGTQNNYEVYFEIRNNKFTCVLYEVFYQGLDSNGKATSDNSWIMSYAKTSTLRVRQEFVATYKQKDLTIYDGSVHFGLYGELEYRNENAIDISAKLLLDEARFTVGDARHRDNEIVPTEPFPDYLQNVIEIQPNFALSAIYGFGSNNTIAFDARATFRDYTKKPKVVVPIIVPIEFYAPAIIRISPDFIAAKGNSNEGNQSSEPNGVTPYSLDFSVAISTTNQSIFITKKIFSQLSTLEIGALFYFHDYQPLRLDSQGTIEVLPNFEFEEISPIPFLPKSEISIGAELLFRQIKTEIVYLPAENKSKVSTGFVDMLLGGFGVSETLNGGSIEFYTGSRPYSANHATTGKLLGVITGIQFGIPANRVISKSTSELWDFTGLATGKIGWFRIKSDSSFTDYGQDSVREVRIDGEAGVDAISSNFDVIAGGQYFIDKFYIAWSN